MNNMFGNRPPVPMGQNTFLPRQQVMPQAGQGAMGTNTFLSWFGQQGMHSPARQPAMGQNTFLGAMGRMQGQLPSPHAPQMQPADATASILRALIRR